MKITKSHLRNIISEEMKNISEVYPPGPEGLSARDKLRLGPAQHRGSLEFPEDDEDEAGFFYLEKGENNFRDSSPSNAFHPASYDNDPAKFAQRIIKQLNDKGQPLTFNVYDGVPFKVASQNAVLQVINGEIIKPGPNEWGADPEDILTSPDEERYTSGVERYDENKTRITKKQLRRFIKEEVLGALK